MRLMQGSLLSAEKENILAGICSILVTTVIAVLINKNNNDNKNSNYANMSSTSSSKNSKLAAAYVDSVRLYLELGHLPIRTSI